MDTENLIKECRRGNLYAQKQLYNQYAEQMLGVCFRYTRQLEDAEDVLQDGFVKVFKNIHQFRQDGPLGAWIRKIMVNTALNYLKSHARYSRELFVGDVAESLHPVSNDKPAEMLESKLSAMQIALLIQKLPVGYQTVFNLHALDGYAHADIAEMLGIRETTSRTQYFKARKVLMEWMEREGDSITKSGHHAR